TNTNTFFSTATDTTTEAANLRDAINRTALISAVVTATSDGNQVLVTANTAGIAGNGTTTTPTSTTSTNFFWGAGTTLGGVDAQPSILAVNQLYTGAATTASATGTF